MKARREHAMRQVAALFAATLLWSGPSQETRAQEMPGPAMATAAAAAGAQTNSVSRKRVTDPQAGDEAEAKQLLDSGAAQLKKKDFQGAVATFEDYTDKVPDDAFGHFQLGYAYAGLGDSDRAADEFQQATEIDPNMGEAFLNWGLTLLEKTPADAVEPLRQAAELMPKDARAELRLGEALERTGQTAPAIEAFRASVARDKNDPEAHAGLARELLKTNDASGAETEFRAALVLQPACSTCRGGLIDALLSEKKTDAAESELAKLLQQRPGDPAATFALARLFAQQGDNSAALEQLDKAASGGPQTLDALKLRATVLLQMKNYNEAAAAMEKAAALSPKDGDLRASLGRVELQRKDYAAAQRYLLEALQLQPQNLDALKDLLTAEYLAKNYPATLKLLDELAKRETPPMGSWFIRGACYDKLGQKPEAIAAYQKYLELNAGASNDEYFEASSRVRALERDLQNKRK
jgi:cellulose synthase operon protein C